LYLFFFFSFCFSLLILLGVAKLQKEDGSFTGDTWGEVDTRFSYCAVSALSLLGRLELIDREKAIEFILKCKNFDEAFGCLPGAESHAGQSKGKGGFFLFLTSVSLSVLLCWCFSHFECIGND